MQTISITDFKARCLALLQELSDTNESLVITKHGKPFAEVRPCKQNVETALKKFRGSVVHCGDIVSPIEEAWDANR
ncbi:MAG: type II toxin-antitoxin system Phd/YefM family antitoxin [Gemmatimonadetes bacterium]|jgi:antitoxin (DNA-binding transcriptional repressor) of toxin-antitoxin stability system|nr:type II toxin-antitoxin system Phd/YefM family antitoxin [Gemmatimonadota bacterium]